jgi:DTW domain-containing protein
MCDAIVRVATRTRVVLLIHRSEDRKSTNTGRLAARCLTNSEVVIRGHRESPTDHLPIPEETRPLLLFPFEGATDVRAFARSSVPLTLIVPDGTWRQASKVRNRVPGLRDITCVSLPPGPQSDYRLRVESHETRVCTIEAIARALGVLEGPEVQKTLQDAFSIMVRRTLFARDASLL